MKWNIILAGDRIKFPEMDQITSDVSDAMNDDPVMNWLGERWNSVESEEIQQCARVRSDEILTDLVFEFNDGDSQYLLSEDWFGFAEMEPTQS